MTLTVALTVTVLGIGGVVASGCGPGDRAGGRRLGDVSVSDPSILRPGTRLVGVRIRIHSTGNITLDPPVNTVQAIDPGGMWDKMLGSAGTRSGAPTDVVIPPGRMLDAYVVASDAVGTSVVRAEYSYEDSKRHITRTLDWVVPAAPSPRLRAADGGR